MTLPQDSQIDPGSVLGVLGGGQLGAMFVVAAHRLGYRVSVWDPDSSAPAHREADRSIIAPFTHTNALDDFADGLAAATYEWENVPALLCEQIEARVPVRPATGALRTIQHRGAQKRFLADQGFPVTAFLEIRSRADLEGAATLGYPCLLKTATAGYDGKGQWRLNGAADTGPVRDVLPAQAADDRAWILEAVVPFVRELSVLVARGLDGHCVSYPVVENVHERGILRVTTAPAPIDRELREKARHLCETVVAAFESPGVFCVELFLLPDGSLLVNEIAPRPHNSGHYTLDACTVSQFEQQVRALCGLPLGEVRLTSAAAMINLLGEEAVHAVRGTRLRALLARPGVHLHLYRKREVRAGRKMGHVTVTGETPESVRATVEQLLLSLEGVVAS